MTEPRFKWLVGMAAAYQPASCEEEASDPVPGIIEEVRDDSPTRDEQHVRVVLQTESGLVDVAHDRIEVVTS